MVLVAKFEVAGHRVVIGRVAVSVRIPKECQVHVFLDQRLAAEVTATIPDARERVFIVGDISFATVNCLETGVGVHLDLPPARGDEKQFRYGHCWDTVGMLLFQ